MGPRARVLSGALKTPAGAPVNGPVVAGPAGAEPVVAGLVGAEPVVVGAADSANDGNLWFCLQTLPRFFRTVYSIFSDADW